MHFVSKAITTAGGLSQPERRLLLLDAIRPVPLQAVKTGFERPPARSR